MSFRSLNMIGEQVGEVSGKVTAIRVLAPDGPNLQFEITAQGAGTLLGVAVTLVGSYQQIVRPDKSIFCPVGHVVLTSAEGDTLYWTGYAVGAFTGPPPASRILPCGHVQTTAAKWARLTCVAVVTEWVLAEDGTGVWKLWEWK